jgi:hypothetical protein
MSPRPLADPEAERARELVHQRHSIKRVERAAAKVAAARAELEVAMRTAREAGVALRPLAEASGLSVEWTRRLTS